MKPNRLASLDALRGFDMFFIMGGATLITGLCTVLGWGDGWLAQQMRHVPWAGLAHHDTIFPLFLFLAGVSWPFSLASQQARGISTAQIHLKILRRAATLFLLGFAFGGILTWKPTFRLMSVLGFIGLSWGFAALIFLHVQKTSTRAIIMAALAIGYFALLHFTGFPGAPEGADVYSKEWNIIRWLDIHAYPLHLLVPALPDATKVPYEPESLFSVPSGMLLALLGMTAGAILKSATLSAPRKALLLLGAGVASLALDLVLVFIVGVPIVKALWTVSFIFAAAAYSFLLLALFYWLVDVRGCKRWTILFDPVGKNSILVYTLSMMGVTHCIWHFLFNGTASQCGAANKIIVGLGYYLITWCVARYCQKKDIYIKA